MARKIKIKIKDEDTRLNLPAVSIGIALFVIRCTKTKIKKYLKEKEIPFTYEDIYKIVKACVKELDKVEPFVLVEVKNELKNEHVLVEVK